MKLFTLLAIIVSIADMPVFAQSVKAIVIQLNSEQNKISYFLKAGKNKEAENISLEASEASKKMIADFSDNFSYCPVYYYIDTNANKIRNKQFKGILLNANELPENNPVINSSDTDYLVIRYGYPDENTSVRNTKDLVIYNDKFIRLFRFHRHEPDKITRKYVYISTKYDIDYYPAAKELNRKIQKRYEE